MRILLVFLGALLLAGPAAAQDRPALRFDPDRIEFATPWAQSSPCLGDTRDPVCLAQTVVICWVLHRRPECADGRYGQPRNPQLHERIEYRIIRAGIVPLDKLNEMQDNLLGFIDTDLSPMSSRRAVVAQFIFRHSICPAIEGSCEGYLASSLMVVVERTRVGWTLVVGYDDTGNYWYAD